MPLPRQEVDGTTPKYLRDKYAIVGVGETTYTRGSGKTTRALGTWAVRNAMLDAGLKPSDIDGMLDYSGGDSTSATFIGDHSSQAVRYTTALIRGVRTCNGISGNTPVKPASTSLRFRARPVAASLNILRRKFQSASSA